MQLHPDTGISNSGMSSSSGSSSKQTHKPGKNKSVATSQTNHARNRYCFIAISSTKTTCAYATNTASEPPTVEYVGQQTRCLL